MQSSNGAGLLVPYGNAMLRFLAMSLSQFSLNFLRTFEAVARKKSFTAAANELHVTHAAVSHQIKALEDRLGVTLLQRHGRSTELTEAGKVLFPVLSDSFNRIAGALHGLSNDKAADVLHTSLTPTFATKWLVPRLRKFKALHPEIELRLTPSLRYIDFEREHFDVAIRCGHGNWPGLSTTYLLPIDLTPVCSPSLLQSGPGLRKISDLRHYTLFHADVGEHPIGEEWDSWLRVAGMTLNTTKGMSFHDPSLATQAAVEGLGVAIGYVAIAAAEISEGKLVAPFNLKVRSPWSYYVVCPKAKANLPKISKFRTWLLSEAGQEDIGARELFASITT
jgi:LysR family transcriptional regulator, glycine cleavage system transcriptional activator